MAPHTARALKLIEDGKLLINMIPAGSTGNAIIWMTWRDDPFSSTPANRRTLEAEENLEAIFLEAAMRGDIPVAIAGDFQYEPDQSTALRRHIESGQWVDIVTEFHSRIGTPCRATY